MFSVQTPRIIDESLASYVLRLSAQNGFHSPLDWLESEVWTATTQNALTEKLVRRLNQALVAPVRLPQAQYTTRHSHIYESYRLITPRLCLRCIAENGYHKENWQALTTMECDVHHCALVDSCAHCHHTLTWSPGLLQNRCTHTTCGKSLHQRGLMQGIKDLFIDELCDCLLASLFSENPQTTYLPIHKRLSVPNLNEKLEQGFFLLTEEDECRRLYEALWHAKDDWQGLPCKYRLFPLQLLKNSLKTQWPLHDWRAPLNNHAQASAKHQYTGEYIVTAHCAKTLLSISKNDLLSLPTLAGQKNISINKRVDVAPLISK